LRVEAAIVNAARKAVRPAKAPGRAIGRGRNGHPKADIAKPSGEAARLGNYPRQVDQNLHRMDIFRSLLAPLKPGRLLDLGCGVGNFSQTAHAMGWKVTAVDARGQRLPGESVPGIEWVESDVRDFRFGPDDYDCVCVLGLLYHLELPAQIDLLRRCSDTFTLLDTHTALQPEVTEGGYEGKYFKEVPWAKTEEERRDALGSSWGNRQSFWATEESLVKMLRHSGFSLVSALQPAYLPDRTFYLCYP